MNLEFEDFLSACDGKMDQKTWQWKYLKDLIVMIGIFLMKIRCKNPWSQQ